MADQAVLEREPLADKATEQKDVSERPRLFKRFAGPGVTISFPVPPDKIPDYWFD